MRPPAADPCPRTLPPPPSRVLLALALGVAACAHAAARAPADPAPPQVTLRAAPGANDGQPFYVVFQATSEREFTTVSYRDAAESAFTNAPGVLATALVLPDRVQVVALPQHGKGTVAAYFLFTRPGRTWKVLLPQPLGARCEIAIRSSEVELLP